MSKKKLNLGNIESVGALVGDEIESHYKDNTQKQYAHQAKQYALQYLWELPVGMSGLDDKDRIHDEMVSYVQDKFDNPPKGFFPLAFIAMAILSSIISFVITKMLHKLFD